MVHRINAVHDISQLTPSMEFIIFLLVLNIGSCDKHMTMHKLNNEYVTLWSSLGTLVTYYQIQNIFFCVTTCMADSTCQAIAFDKVNFTCTLAVCAITQPIARNISVDLYQTVRPLCNSTPGFIVETNGNTSACLWWSDTNTTFTQARDDCKAKGSILATFKTWEKFQILKQKGVEIYIGLDDIEVEGVFRWHDDGSVLDMNSSYSKQIFTPGNPDDYMGNEDCVGLLDKRGLNDVPCTHLYRYVCEKTCFAF